MAAIEKVSPVYVAPPGMEVIDRGYALDAIEAGDPVVISEDPAPSRLYDCAIEKATGDEAHGIALKDVQPGGLCEFASQGEMDGFAGLTPGAGLSIVDGEIDDTAPTGAAAIRAVNASRIRFVMV